jgi:hypothetical protein
MQLQWPRFAFRVSQMVILIPGANKDSQLRFVFKSIVLLLEIIYSYRNAKPEKEKRNVAQKLCVPISRVLSIRTVSISC